MSSNNKKNQLAFADLSNFLNTCQNIGVKPDDFNMMIHSIAEHVINGADDFLSACELKKQLLFLSMIETLLNSLKID